MIPALQRLGSQKLRQHASNAISLRVFLRQFTASGPRLRFLRILLLPLIPRQIQSAYINHVCGRNRIRDGRMLARHPSRQGK